MRTLFFVSRHEPTKGQEALAARAGFEMQHIGDFDAFARPEDWQGFLAGHGAAPGEAVAVVHPAAALSLYRLDYAVAVFKNENRAAVGERPQFEAAALVIFDERQQYRYTAEELPW